MNANGLGAALRRQADVVGALIMRELHTRFGRDNIGYLWIFGEPLLLAVAVAVLHANQHLPLAGGVRSVPFAMAGYAVFIMFRSTVSRAETLLEANRPLLNHRQVTLFDMLLARSLLEAASTVAVLAVLLAAAVAFGFAAMPADPLLVVAAVALMAWFSFGMAMVVTALSHESAAAGRLIHPLLYLSMPLSGAFYCVVWLPQAWREAALWIPTVPLFELMRHGLFEGYSDRYAGLLYPAAWCSVLSVIGMAGLRVIRPRVLIA